MSLTSRSIGTGILVLVITLAGTDYFFKERYRTPEDPGIGTSYEPVVGEDTPIPTVVQTTGSLIGVETQTPLNNASSSSSTRAVQKGTSTRKRSSVNVEEVFTRLELIPSETNELSLLAFAASDQGAVTRVLLLSNDRAFLFSWIEDDDAKTIFFGLKKALQEQFSVNVTDLSDETRTKPDGPPVDVLTFFDPAISKEKLYFLRVRNRLYEIHVAENGKAMLEQLIGELSK